MAIRYLSGINVDSNTLFVDSTNNRVGIGTASPAYRLDVNGASRLGSNFIVDSNGDAYQPTTGGVALWAATANATYPSYGFYGDTGIGMYRAAADTLAFSTSDTERLRITAAGNVGIGTTNPTSQLHVQSASPALLLYNTTTAGGTLNFVDQAWQSQIVGIQGNLLFKTGGTTERMRIADNGLVGIGTTSPSDKLTVSVGNVEGIRVQSSNSGFVEVGKTGGARWRWANDYNNSNLFELLVNDLAGGVPGAHVITVNGSNGAVGIGTTTPGYRLDVNGDVNTSGVYRIGGNTILSGTTSVVVGSSGATGSVTLRTTSGDGLILNGGNVGIGTTSPASKLQSNTSSTYNSATPSGAIIASNLSGGNAIIDIGVDASYLGYIQSRNILNTTAYNLLLNPIGGNVGIGTNSPADRLYVGNTAGTSISVSTNLAAGTNGSPLNLDLNFRGYADVKMAMIRSWDESASTGNGHLTFWTNEYTGVNVFTEKMRIGPTGSIKLNSYGSGSNTGTATQRLAVDASGNVIEIPIGSGPVDGNGTANYVTKWSDADTITNSIIYDNGTNVGIGTTSPTEKLHVNGSVSIYGDLNFTKADGIGINAKESMVFTIDSDNNDTGRIFQFREGSGNTLMIIQEAGNVGIGTTSPASILHVEGGSPTTNLIASSGNGFLRIADSATSATRKEFTILLDNTNNRVDIQAIQQGVAARNITLNASGGSVGIGTTEPQRKLDSYTVGGAVLGNNYVRFGVGAEGAYGGNNHLEFSYNDYGNVGGRAFDNILATIQGNTDVVTPTDVGGTLIFSTKARGGTYLTAPLERMRITSAGNVGIGTTSPVSHAPSRRTLVVADTVNGANVEIWGNNGGGKSILQSVGGDTYVGNLANGSGAGTTYITSGNGSTYTTILANGNVGIGTTSPGAKIHVVGSESRFGGVASGYISVYNATSRSGYIQANGGTDLRIASDSDPMTMYVNGSERMRITSGGNIVIGNTTAYGGLTVSDFSANDGNDSISLFYRGTTGNHESLIKFYDFRGQLNASLGNNLGNDGVGTQEARLVFKTSTGGSVTEKMRITGGGNVGIGTTSPATKLHVVGYSRTDGGILVNGGVSDYREIIFTTLAFARWNLYAYGAEGGGNAGSVLNLARYADDGSYLSGVMTFLRTNGYVGVNTGSPSEQLHVTGNVRVTGAYYDSNNEAGTSGQVLTSTGSGTDWKSLSEITGVDGTGTANYVAKWSDTDTIANSQIRDDGTTVGIGTAPAAAKLTVNGPVNVGGRYLYNNFQEYLDTTGINVAGLSASSNGDSAFFTFEAGAGSGHYQRIVYSCYNEVGTWNVVKVIDEGTNVFDVVASASSGSTITFTWKTRSGIIYYTPRLIITGVGSIDTTYL